MCIGLSIGVKSFNLPYKAGFCYDHEDKEKGSEKKKRKEKGSEKLSNSPEAIQQVCGRTRI